MEPTSTLTKPALNAARPTRNALWQQYGRGLVVALAFLLALTTARNPGIWTHLASGRSLLSSNASSEFHPSTWLADAGMYVVYSIAGGPGLVILKALVIAGAIATLMVGSWRTVVTALLAALALGAWLQLAPICFGYLFSALTVVTLGFAGPAGGTQASSWLGVVRSRWPLLLGFVVWANVDAWCVLGVAYVAMAALSATIVRTVGGGGAGPSWRLALLITASACISPMPWMAANWAREFAGQYSASALSASPFSMISWSPLVNGRFEGAVPVLAFWVLLAATIASFLPPLRADRREIRSEACVRLLPWLAIVIAAAFSSSFVPFAIIVCGATSALNLRVLALVRDASQTSATVRGRSPVERLQSGLRLVLGLLAGVLLLGAAWAGWLQSRPYERRNWTIEADPSLLLAAEVVDRWYAEGRLQPEQETVFLSPDAQELFSWFAPKSEPAHHGPQRVEQLRRAVLAEDRGPSREDVPDPLMDPRVGCVVVSDQNRSTFAQALQFFTGGPNLWKLAHLRGRVAVFVRTQSSLAAVDLPARAFSIASADRAESSSGSEYAITEHWYDPFVLPRPGRSLDRDESISYLLIEEATRSQRMQAGARRFLAELVASLVGNPWPYGGAVSQRTLVLEQALRATDPRGGGSPFPFERFAAFELLLNSTPDYYLSLRAARRGVNASPRDAATFESLGQAYLHVLADPIEASWGRQFTPLKRLRLVQAAAAFRQALTLDPNLAPAHLGLATVYLENQYLDLALASFQSYEALTKHSKKSSGEGVEALEKTVADARQKTEANAANLTVLDRAKLALRNGLAGEALDLLLHSDVAVFGNQGLALEFDLLLATGRVVEARDWLAPEHRGAVGLLAYNWYEAQALAAMGDYAGASNVLSTQIASLPMTHQVMNTGEVLKALGFSAREVLHRRQNAPRMGVGLLASLVSQFGASCSQVLFERRSRTEAHLLVAFLALEEGNLSTCAASLESIRVLWESVADPNEGLPIPYQTIVQQLGSMISR